MEHEVIVVGAGPGGATSAMALAQQGHDVLLLDRHTFPRDKICGDGIPASAMGILNRYGLAQRIAKSNFYPINSLLIVAPGGNALESVFPPPEPGTESYVVPRILFDNVLFEHTVASGAKYQQAQVIEPLLERGRVVGVRARINGSTQEIRSRLVIGADGVTSTIARALRPDKQEEMHRAVAIRAYVDDFMLHPHQVEFYLYKEILPGYAWIFPTADGQANVGLGIRLDHFRRVKGNLGKMLDFFLNLPDIKKRFKPTTCLHGISSWQLNFGSQRFQRAYEGALLVGDAAGLINPLTGGGIYNAIVSAEVAAAVSHEALLDNDLSRNRLHMYEIECDKRLWESMRHSFFLQHWLLRFPRLVDLLIRYMGANSSFAQTFLDKL